MSPDKSASIRARLLNRAKANGEEFELTLTRYAVERWLYRLGASDERTRCILKGASLLAVWLDEPYRATRDIDVLASGATDPVAIRKLVQSICDIPCAEDGLRFDLTELEVDAIRADEEYVGQRARFRACLGQARIRVQVDFGVGDALAVDPQEVDYPTILPELPAPRLRSYRREQSVAEKFEAMVKLDTRNSRMKDFHDVWALAGNFSFDGLSLQRAVAACFARRGVPWTTDVPPVLTPAFYRIPQIESRWRAYHRSTAVRIAPPDSFAAIGERITEFLGPVRVAICDSEPLTGRWMPGGPWTPEQGSTRKRP